MWEVGISILCLAALGVACCVVSLLDAIGVLDLDAPEKRHEREELDDEEL